MKTRSVFLAGLMFLSPSLRAQLISPSVDRFERARWGMSIADVRAMAPDTPQELMRSVKTGKIVVSNHHVFLVRKEIAFGESLRVSYVIHTADSALRQVVINAVEFAVFSNAPQGRHDSVWSRIARRYGPWKSADANRRTWDLPASSIEAYHFDGPASGVTFIVRPRRFGD